MYYLVQLAHIYLHQLKQLPDTSCLLDQDKSLHVLQMLILVLDQFHYHVMLDTLLVLEYALPADQPPLLQHALQQPLH